MSNLEPGLPAQALGTPSALGSWSDQRQARLRLTLCGGRCGPTLRAVGSPLAPDGLQVRRSLQSGSGEGFEEGFETCVPSTAGPWAVGSAHCWEAVCVLVCAHMHVSVCTCVMCSRDYLSACIPACRVTRGGPHTLVNKELSRGRTAPTALESESRRPPEPVPTEGTGRSKNTRKWGAPVRRSGSGGPKGPVRPRESPPPSEDAT